MPDGDLLGDMDTSTAASVAVIPSAFTALSPPPSAIPASSRVPPEILFEIFALLTKSQTSLRECALVCRQWSLVATPVLWRRPRFHRLANVERFASTLMPVSSGTTAPSASSEGLALETSRGNVSAVTSYYAKLVETLSFSTLPEVDRNNPHLATLLDTIVNCMVVLKPVSGTAVATTSSLGLPVNWAVDLDGAAATGAGRGLLSPPSIKRSRSLSRNDNNNNNNGGNNAVCVGGGCVDDEDASAGRPLSTTDLPLADDAAITIAATMLGTGSAASAHGAGGQARERPATSAAVYTSSLRQLDLRFCKGVRNYSLQRLAPRLASIKVLNLAGGLRTDITIAKLSQHMVDLRRISLAWTSNLTDFGVSELVQRCKDIEALDLTYCTQIEDTSMFAIAHNLRCLTALSVAYCAGVTDIGVREVATRCTEIRIVDVAKCLRVTDRMRQLLGQRSIAFTCDSFDPFSIHYKKLQHRPSKT